ncbi:MAG TPA: hypothetical protein VL027_07995 [Spongiibacteraceae bacterium]|jgi:uncharacterized membrane protein|nr:hypothetical protein [Spongiibacteraceae bacterium]HUH37870.1 hypothetical protein [Spongiibacteraceae bacterium]
MADIGAALALHVLGVVWWLGGVAFVSTVVLPHLRRDPANAMAGFHNFEQRFAPQARIAVLLVGLSGGWLLWRTQLWRVLDQPQFGWLAAMILYWALFFLMLFVLGPSGLLRRVMSGSTERSAEARLLRMQRMHLLLLFIGLAIVAWAVAARHGL